jgi:hypothetical protein
MQHNANTLLTAIFDYTCKGITVLRSAFVGKIAQMPRQTIKLGLFGRQGGLAQYLIIICHSG